MKDKNFQFSFSWQTIITFSFFSLISFILVFFLGVLVGKNSALIFQENVFPKSAVVEKKIKKQVISTTTKKNEEKSNSKVSEQEAIEKPIKKLDSKLKAIIKKDSPRKISKETEYLFRENHYVIQVIAYKSKVKAENLQSLLKKNFYPAYINKITKDGIFYYRVRIGSYALEEAKRVQQDLQKEFSNLRNTRIFSIK